MDFFSILCHIICFRMCSSGGVAVYSGAKPFYGAYADAGQGSVNKKKVVVLGTGWGGVSFLKNLKNPSYELEVVSPRNYFAFTPLLPSVTVGTVEARSVVEPIRSIAAKVSHHITCQAYRCYTFCF